MQMMVVLGEAALRMAEEHPPTSHPTILEDPERHEPREANEIQLWKMQAQSSRDM